MWDCGQVVVVDEDIMSHTQLGNDNLLIMPDTTGGVLEVDANHSVLVSARNCSIVWMELSTETGTFMYTTKRAFPLTWCPLRDAW